MKTRTWAADGVENRIMAGGSMSPSMHETKGRTYSLPTDMHMVLGRRWNAGPQAVDMSSEAGGSEEARGSLVSNVRVTLQEARGGYSEQRNPEMVCGSRQAIMGTKVWREEREGDYGGRRRGRYRSRL